MNPDTNELVRFIGNIEKLRKKGFIPIPQTLEKAARLMLGNKKSVIVSRTSGGKLSKWAAKKRKQKHSKKGMVSRCNDFYDALKE